MNACYVAVSLQSDMTPQVFVRDIFDWLACLACHVCVCTNWLHAIVREVAICVRESQVMASVNKEWADTVSAVKGELTRTEILKIAAELVQGLGIRTLQHAKRNKTISFQDIMRHCHHFS